MTPWWWSLLLAVVGVAGLYLAGRKSWVGWAVGLAAQLLWVAYALVSDQYGFLLSAAAYGWVYALNLARWRREQRADRLPYIDCPSDGCDERLYLGGAAEVRCLNCGCIVRARMAG